MWYHFLNVPVPIEDKIDDVKDSFYKELEHISDKFLKYCMKILLLDFNGKVSREDIFKQIIGNEGLHKINIDNVIFVVNFAMPKNLAVKSTVPTSQHS
jgi:hypothetical protein